MVICLLCTGAIGEEIESRLASIKKSQESS
jgi:hypothetical protein